MRTIKRYSNRKLYDTVDKRYITLDQIAELVRDGQDIRVVENQTGQDLTNITLSQILLEQEKANKSNIPKSFFMNLIQRSSTSVADFWKKNVLTYFDSEEKIEQNVDALVAKGDLEQEEAAQLKSEIKSRSQTFRQRLDELVEARVQAVLGALHIPSKAEIDGLRQQIKELNAQLDELGAASAKSGEE